MIGSLCTCDSKTLTVYRNPNGEGLVEWKPFTRQGENYLILKPQCQQASHFYPEEMEFWNTKIRNLDTSDVQLEDRTASYREEL